MPEYWTQEEIDAARERARLLNERLGMADERTRIERLIAEQEKQNEDSRA